MRVYVLQIHDLGNLEKIDGIYLFSDFGNLCGAFERRIKRFVGEGFELLEKSDPTMDDCGEVLGGFVVGNVEGTRIIGKTYDYDLPDDD